VRFRVVSVGRKEENRGDETIWVIIHTYLEIGAVWGVGTRKWRGEDIRKGCRG
jgi:hypothetical protein